MRAMWRLWVILFEVLFITIAFFVVGCRADTPFTLKDRESFMSESDGDPENESENEQTTNSSDYRDDYPDPASKKASERRSKGEKRRTENTEYATDITLIAGCESNPLAVAIPRNHAVPTDCESVQLIAAKDADGDFYQVPSTFQWGVQDPSMAQLTCSQGGGSESCQIETRGDMFSVDESQEPATTLWACAVNDCANSPAECKSVVCATLQIVSVLNLEDSWIFQGATFDPITVTAFSQDGRAVRDDVIGLDGEIQAATLTLRRDGMLYLATVSADRHRLDGYAWIESTQEFLGTWEANRLTENKKP